jgi:hypothetical protein
MWTDQKFSPLLVGMKNMRILWKNLLTFLQGLNIELPYFIAILLLNMYTKVLQAKNERDIE